MNYADPGPWKGFVADGKPVGPVHRTRGSRPEDGPHLAVGADSVVADSAVFATAMEEADHSAPRKRLVADGNPATPVHRTRGSRPEGGPRLAVGVDSVEADGAFLGTGMDDADRRALREGLVADGKP